MNYKANPRPDASSILKHPYFWSNSKKLLFLQDLSDRLDSEPKNSGLIKTLERQGLKIVGTDWHQKFNNLVIEQLSKYRKYDGSLVQDLLRAIRNKVK